MTVDQFLECADASDRMALMKSRTNRNAVEELRKFCEWIPYVDVDYSIKPIAQTILKIDLNITPNWRFNPKWHMKSEVFWVLFDDQQELLHSETITIEQEFVMKRRSVNVSFYVRYKGEQQSSYRLLVTSDRWLTDTEGW